MNLVPLLVFLAAFPQDPFEAALPKPVPLFKHDVPFRTAAVSPDGTILVGLDAEGSIRGWDTRSGRRLYGRPVHARGDGPKRLTCSPDGRYVAISSRECEPSVVLVLRLSTGAEVRRLERCFSPVFSPDGEILAGTDGAQLRRWALKSGAELPGLVAEGQEFKWAAWSPKGDRVAASDALSGDVVVWDLATRQGTTYVDPESLLWPATSLAFAPDGKVLAAGNSWGIRFLSLTGEPAPSPAVHEEYAIGPLKYSADGRRMIALSRRRRLLIWDLFSGRPLFTWSAYNTNGGTLEVSEAGDRAVWFDRDGLRVERIPEILGGKEDGHVVTRVTFAIDGRAITADDAGRVRFWNPATQKELQGLQVPARQMNFFARHGRWGIYGGGPDAVEIWDLPAAKQIAKVPAIPFVGAIAVSPDETTLALGHADGSLSLWSIAEQKERARVHLELAGVSAISWSLGGKTLAWGDERGAVVLAEGAAGRDPIRFKPRADQGIRELVFREDGKTLWARNAGGAWWAYKDDVTQDPVQIQAGEPYDAGPVTDPRWVASGFMQTAGPYRSAFSPDGKYAITATPWGTALIWEAPGGK